mgnify:CR=1 FL=1
MILLIEYADKNLENIFKSLSIKPIKKLSNMREKVDLN